MWSFTQRSSLWKLGCKVLAIKCTSEKSRGLLSGNDLENKYIQISSKNTPFFQTLGLQIHLGTSKQILFLLLMDSNKVSRDHLWKRPYIYTEFATWVFGLCKKMKNVWTEVGISLRFIDYHIPANEMMGEYLENESQKSSRGREGEVVSGLVFSALGYVTW